MFSERLRLLRSETNLTQEEIALKFNVSRQVYANWEAKRSEPDITMIVTIANYFGVSIDYLCGVTVSQCANDGSTSRFFYMDYRDSWYVRLDGNHHAASADTDLRRSAGSTGHLEYGEVLSDL